MTLGRSDRGPFAAAIDRYRARLDAASGGVEVRALKASRLASAAQRRAADAETLLTAARAAGGRTVLLDERGASFTTAALAAHVAALEVRGESRLTLLVGAADGVDEGARAQVDAIWSLSPLTLPHELALVVLLEQLYRVASLASGHPYHRP
ncbi:MAG: 50S rRNA methyltransferase [Trueperaceae bacterium]|nr:MAG: 50S rRNA methyltransferase [Trueperaceae bacterium]